MNGLGLAQDLIRIDSFLNQNGLAWIKWIRNELGLDQAWIIIISQNGSRMELEMYYEWVMTSSGLNQK